MTTESEQTRRLFYLFYFAGYIIAEFHTRLIMLIMYTSQSFLRQGESLASLPTISTHCVYGCLLAAAGILPRKILPQNCCYVFY